MDNQQELMRLVKIKPEDMSDQDVLALKNRREEILPLLQTQHAKTAGIHNKTGPAFLGLLGAYLLAGAGMTTVALAGSGAVAGMSVSTAIISFLLTSVVAPIAMAPLLGAAVLVGTMAAIGANAITTAKVARCEAKLDFLKAEYEPASRYSVSNRKNVGNVDDQLKDNFSILKKKLRNAFSKSAATADADFSDADHDVVAGQAKKIPLKKAHAAAVT
jgi:hypothetical protein